MIGETEPSFTLSCKHLKPAPIHERTLQFMIFTVTATVGLYEKKRLLRRGISSVFVLLIVSQSYWCYAQDTLQVGYSAVRLESGTRIPVGTAVFSYSNGSGVLVTEAGVGAVEPVARGRIFVDEVETRTGLALVNPEAASQLVNLTLRDVNGVTVGEESLVMNPGEHIARFADELFGTSPGFEGSLSFESAAGLGAITLRQSANRFDEPLFTTLPVANLDAAAGSEAVVFPHLTAGGGFRTQVILINPSADSVSGRIRLTRSDGTPLTVDWDGLTVSENTYQIGPNGVYRAELTRTSDVAVGYAVLTPETGVTPSGSVVFQLRNGTQLVTEAGVGVTEETTTARISLDNVGRQSGVAIANRGSGSADVVFVLQDRFGVEQDRVARTVPPGGHLARMAQELFPTLELGFSGLMEIQSPVPIAPITLQLTINTRGELVMTTLPVADLIRPNTTTLSVFPHIVIGSGFETRLVFMNGEASQVNLEFYSQNGTPMTVPLGSDIGNQFTFGFAANESQRLFPGDTSTIASISLRDPVTNAPTTEITINEGNTIRPRILAVDSTGKARDDLSFTLASLDTAVATASNNQIIGNQRGFSTLTIQSAQSIATATITVVGIESGASGAFGTGIAQDLGGRLYLASTSDHTVVRADSLSQSSEIYAGQQRQAGLRNDLRLAAAFSGPAFLTLDQSRGELYVSDAANHVIRTIAPGPNGRTTTLAGTGSAGSGDGSSTEAAFNNPQGVALDNRGHLWIADRDNHTVRRMNLITGQVQTVAGLAGQPGSIDGQGGNARFNNPTGIAVEPETAAEQLARELRGEPPPPIRIILTDTGNGTIRRVDESGAVTTLREPVSTSAISNATGVLRSVENTDGAPLSFQSPLGIAADVFGNIYVAEPGQNDVRTILPDRQLVSAVPADTFVGPKGIVVTRSGKIVISDSEQTAREVTYGTPVIEEIIPVSVANEGGETVTIRGRNFGPGTVVVVAGVLVENPIVADTTRISFVAPPLPSGRTTLTVQNRGGLAQSAFLIETVPFINLPATYITTVAGGSTFAGDGGPSTEAPINPFGVTVDSDGNLFIADKLKNRVRRMDRTTGIITTVAGTGIAAHTGDGGLATAATFDNPSSIVFDTAGNLYVADTYNSVIRKIAVGTQVVTTVAGGGEYGFVGDGGPALEAHLEGPMDVAVDGSGNVFIADGLLNRIRRVDGATGIITTVAGTGQAGYSGDGGRAFEAMLDLPAGITLDASDNLLIADANNNRVRKVDGVNGVITTIVGTGEDSLSGDGGPAIGAALSFPSGISVDGADNLFIADDGNGLIRMVDVGTNVITTVAGDGSFEFSGDGGLSVAAGLNSASDLAIDSGGNLFIADVGNRRIRQVDPRSRIITTVAGGGTDFLGDGSAAAAAVLTNPRDIAFDSAGNLFVVDENNERIRRIDKDTGVITTIAGGADYPESGLGDGGLATDAPLSSPAGIAFDGSGNLFISDTWHHEIRRVDASTGVITRVAGTGLQGFSGDGGLATEAELSVPEAIAISDDGFLYIADTENFRIRRIQLDAGTITTVAGTGTNGFSGDGGPGVEAALSSVADIEIDSEQNLLIVDTDPNSRIRKLDITTGQITTIAGGGTIYDQDGAPAIDSELFPLAITEHGGDLYFIEGLIQGIRRIDASGLVWTIAGTGQTGTRGDGGPARSAEFAYPRAIRFDSTGNLYVADSFNNRIRVIRGPVN